QRQRAGDGDALSLSTGKFVGIALRCVAGEPDMAQQVRYAIVCFSPLGDAVHVERLGHRESDGQARIKRRKGILKYHLDFGPERTRKRGLSPRTLSSGSADGGSSGRGAAAAPSLTLPAKRGNRAGASVACIEPSFGTAASNARV